MTTEPSTDDRIPSSEEVQHMIRDADVAADEHHADGNGALSVWYRKVALALVELNHRRRCEDGEIP